VLQGIRSAQNRLTIRLRIFDQIINQYRKLFLRFSVLKLVKPLISADSKNVEQITQFNDKIDRNDPITIVV